MCIAVPAEVVSIDGPSALVDVYGERFVVSLMMMSEPVQPGDFVALQAQRYAVSKIAREDAIAARCFFEEAFPELAARAPVPRVA
ncbi:MAG TPA: HypC/HybG/HupF family hydrogenase formation chaperone [Xanthobacteraceae bacterium]|nr:HypC/HybG/HupF family hydrogenase formation chaperone [Xanthobacteraceae bacterium]